MRLFHVRVGLPLALAAQLLLAGAAASQEACPDGRIAVVFVDNHSIFDPDDLNGEQPLRLGYRVANALHMRTRESFLRSELLFQVGDCYDARLLEESERIIRGHRFISRVDVYGLRQDDGSWHVLVDTKDEWTTKVNVRARLDGGLVVEGVSLREENILGRGILAGVFFREHEEQ